MKCRPLIREGRMTKPCKEIIIGNRFITSHKKQQTHYVGAIGLLCIDRGPGISREMSAMVTNYVTDPPGWFCDSLWNVGDNGGLNLPQCMPLYDSRLQG